MGSAAFRAAVAPGGLLAGPWVRHRLWRAARAVPSLDLRFADSKSLVDTVTGQSLVTFTRASNATYVDSTGRLQTAANDVPRFDHNPTTGESLGLLVEEARTNSIRNNTMQGAVAGTPGTDPTNWLATGTISGITKQVVGTGTEDGINYIDIRYSGTPTTNQFLVIAAEPNTQIVAANGQPWTGSWYTRLIGGSVTNIGVIRINTFGLTAAGASVSGQNGIQDIQTLISSAALSAQRYRSSFTFSGATVERVNTNITITTTTGNPINITLRIGLPQLEQGSFATSVIPTSDTAATRSADVASITVTNFSSWYNQTEGTIFCDAKEYPFTSSVSRAFYDISNSANSNNDFIRQWIWSGNTSIVRASIYTTNSGPIATDMTTSVINEQKRIALASRANDFAFTYNGGAVSVDTAGNMAVGVDGIFIGSTYSGAFLNGTISRLTYFPKRLSNDTLQRLTQ